ncbi:hypothetical protein KSP39_PZI005315 [Platanthera zijinensis]|uniref:Uncharacterized protein n=1 Tax=Platanthera zijinensis TaxID=2320716 RepID=A0AAP0GAK9_9ASPA
MKQKGTQVEWKEKDTHEFGRPSGRSKGQCCCFCSSEDGRWCSYEGCVEGADGRCQGSLNLSEGTQGCVAGLGGVVSCIRSAELTEVAWKGVAVGLPFPYWNR